MSIFQVDCCNLKSNFCIQIFYVRIANPICTILSDLFLLLTLVTFAALPDLRSTLPGMLEMAFVASLFVSYLLLSIANLLGNFAYKN